MRTKAPGVIKLFGEHAVVYGSTAIAVAIDLYATSKVEDSGSKNTVRITLTDLDNVEIELTSDDLLRINSSYAVKGSISKYILENSGIRSELLPYATIASRLNCNFGINVLGKSVKIHSEIPLQRGLASSAACYTAFATSLISKDSALSEAQAVEIARDGDRVTHKNEAAGKIDMTTSFYGHCVVCSSSGEAYVQKLNCELNFLIVDTGPKKSTAETVGHVAELHKKNKIATEKIFSQINECSVSGMSMLKDCNKKGLGKYMFLNHELLKKLEVSNENLDKVVELSKQHGALGAKLSGGGGGGIAIVLIDKSTQAGELINSFEANEFRILKTSISAKGAKDFLK